MFISGLRQQDLDRDTYEALVQNPLAARSLAKDPAQLRNIIDGYRKGFRIVFITLAALASFAFLMAFIFLRHSTLKRADDQKLKEEALERITAPKN